MKKIPLRNFHVPLSEELYKQLRAEADRSQQSATALDESIRVYAAQSAGTPADLDQELEAASVDHLLDEEEEI